MRNIHFIVSALCILLCGCAQENIDSMASAGGDMVTVRLSTDSAPEIFRKPDTRTMLVEDDVHWNKGDGIRVLGTDNLSVTLININETGPEASFEGRIPESAVNTAVKVALYGAAGNTVGVRTGDSYPGMRMLVMPAEQSLVPGSFDRSCNLSVAAFNILEIKPLYFKNLGGLINFGLKGNTAVKSVTITAPEDINGTFYYSSEGTGSSIRITEQAFHPSSALSDAGNPEASPTVKLISEEGIALKESVQEFYACTLPVKTTGDYVLSIETVQGKVIEKTVPVTEMLGAAQILDIGDFEVVYTYLDADGSSIAIDPEGTEPVVLEYWGTEPTCYSKPDWLDVDIAEGKITIDAELYFGTADRSGDVVLTDGVNTVTFTVVQKSVPAFESLSVDFGKEAGSKDVTKTVYLTDEYTAVPTESWISVSVIPTGLNISVEENVGNMRAGSVIVYLEENVIATIEVSQAPDDYYIYLGEYSISYRDMEGKYKENLKFVINPAVAEGEAGFGEKYIATFTSDVFNYPIELVFNRDSQTAPISLVCPQAIPEQGAHPNIHFMWVHVAKKPVSENFVIKKDFGAGTGDYKEIDVTDEGVGYDLTVDNSDGNVNLIFMPNAKALELYDGGLDGFWIPGNRNNDTEGEYDIIRDWLRPLAGQDYLRIVKK